MHVKLAMDQWVVFFFRYTTARELRLKMTSPGLSAMLLLLVSSTFPLTHSIGNIYYVKPTLDTPCHKDHCHTLSHFVNKADQFFTSNTTLSFLPGKHLFETGVLVVANIDSISLVGEATENKPTIACAHPAAFVFTNISSVEINHLNFLSCGINQPLLSPPKLNLELMQQIISYFIHNNSSPTQFIAVNTSSPFCIDTDSSSTHKWPFMICSLPSIVGFSVTHLKVAKVSVKKSYQPLYIYNTDLVIQGTKFENNTGDYGAGIFIHSVSLVLKEENTFADNTAAVDGGGLFARYSTLTFNGSTGFSKNTAGNNGGGIYMDNSTASFYQNSTFTHNTAGSKGGGVFTGWSTFSLGTDTDFHENHADNGGGLFAYHSMLMFEGKSHFSGNWATTYGGGITSVASIFSFIQCCFFTGNTAHSDGGGIETQTSNFTFHEYSNFVNNTAGRYGGGIDGYYGLVNFVGASTFIVNSAAYGGGAVEGLDSTFTFSDGGIFMDNTAGSFGGGVGLVHSTLYFNATSTFTGNSAGMLAVGGGICVLDHSRLIFGRDSSFIGNSAGDCGGGMLVAGNSTVNFEGECTMSNNSAGLDGGGIEVRGGILHFFKTNNFIDNSAGRYGGAIDAWYASVLNFDGSSLFMSNYAVDEGGGIFSGTSSVVIFNKDTTFMNNSAKIIGGGAEVWNSMIIFKGNSTYIGNSARVGGGGVLACTNSRLIYEGESLYIGNYAENGGGIYALHSKIVYGTNTKMLNNSATNGGALMAVESQVSFYGETTFEQNTADNYGGAIHSVRGNFTFNGMMNFTRNSAAYGGGLSLAEQVSTSVLFLTPNNTFVHFETMKYGGAIKVEDNPYTYCRISESLMPQDTRESCFFQVIKQQGCDGITPYEVLEPFGYNWGIHLSFVNNHAVEAGSVLYGGMLDTCGICTSEVSTHFTMGATAFTILANISGEVNETSHISSQPFHVCICREAHSNCSIRMTTYNKYPGETFSIPVVAVGQRSGTVPTVIHTRIESIRTVRLDNLQDAQEANKSCTSLQYALFTGDLSSIDVNMTLYAEGPCRDSENSLQVSVRLKPCPEGFSLSSSHGGCICEKRLQRFTKNCNINGRTIQHTGEFWVGLDNHSNGLIIHPHCPFDYCILDGVNLTLTNLDAQCANSRSGILCGGCKAGFTLALGSSRCLHCSSTFLLLLGPFAIAGLALVFLLFFLQLTVAFGTISGLIFYANIVAAEQATFFPRGQYNVLTVFIAWLNLDLGLETCFFDGLDTYFKTWLQFAFPLYIWVLVGAIVMASKYSQMVTRVLSHTNPVSVLATLFLLSYTKLLRTIITALSLTTLEYPAYESVAVWVYDGNIKYIEGKHIALFITSLLIFLFLFLPYTLLLIFGQCIQARSNMKLLSWANSTRVKSFLDAYHAPYKDRHRYWVGFLLLVRFTVFIISAVTDIISPRDSSFSLLVVILSVFLLMTWVWNAGGMYKKSYLNALESFFMLNLAFLAATTLYTKQSGGNQLAVVYTSVSIAFATFIGIITYHVQQYLRQTRTWRHQIAPKIQKLRAKRSQELDTGDTTTDNQRVKPEVEALKSPSSLPTYTIVELREPLDLIT